MYDLSESQKQFICDLEKTYNVFSEILNKDPDGLVISGDDRYKLEEITKRNDKLLRKLRSGEFIVAVVGLEKSGKSTLGNAFLKCDILPEYSARCTYTTTEIRSGSEDSGEIFFYTYDEFNRDFKQMLSKLKYDGNADFSSLDVATFERFWNSMADQDPAYRKINSDTAEDIRTILKDRSLITSLLGQASRKFVGADALNSLDFKVYITGIKGYRENNDGSRIAIRSAHPYAVKEVNIRSTNLRDMSHIVLYDVPGFNSPTALHKKQTEEVLKDPDTDAIIFVANVGENPNLDDRQYDMFQTGYDAEGICLNEKCFVFGNKLDKANDEQIAKNNMAVLRNEVVEKYSIADDRRVFFGSAKAYLDMINKVDSRSISTLGEWNMPIGIDELRTSVREYHNNERFEILRKRAEKTLHDATVFLRDILEHTQEVIDQPSDGSEYVIQIKNSLSEFVKEAKLILDGCMAEIARETPFSKLITDNIDSIYASVSKDDEIVRSAEADRNSTTSRVYPTELVEGDIREKLRRNFIREIVSRTADATRNKEQEIYTTLSKKFLEILKVPESSRYYDELEQSIRSVFDDIRTANNGETCRFNTLVKRFTTGLIEAIIQQPFASNTRLRSVRDEGLTEFFSLAAYYAAQKGSFGQDIDLSNDSERLQLFAKIMTHGVENESNENSENYNALKKYFYSQKQQNDDEALEPDQLPIGKWAKMLDRVDLNFDDGTNKIKRSVNGVFFDDSWSGKSDAEKLKAIDDIISKACKNANTRSYDSGSGSLKAIIEDLHNKADKEMKDARSKIGSESVEAQNAALQAMMLKDINIDIVNLRDITVNAVVKAINLEKAFISVITDNGEFIRKDAKDMSDNGKFDAWIIQNKRKIRDNEYAQIERNQTDNITRRNIIENINHVLKDLKV